jgi:hypothetical protein
MDPKTSAHQKQVDHQLDIRDVPGKTRADLAKVKKGWSPAMHKKWHAEGVRLFSFYRRLSTELTSL